MQRVFLTPHQPDDRKPDGIGPCWGACGEDAMWLSIEEGRHSKLHRVHPMKMVDEDDVREAVQIRQPFGKFGQDVDPALGRSVPGRLDGHVLNTVELASYDTDRLVFDVIHGCYLFWQYRLFNKLDKGPANLYYFRYA